MGVWFDFLLFAVTLACIAVLKYRAIAAAIIGPSAIIAGSFFFVGGAWAGERVHIDGQHLGALWIVPFVGLLLSIAIVPLTHPRFWHHNFGKIAAAWALAFLLPSSLVFGLTSTLYELAHTLLLEYIPFVVLLLALFTVAGGVLVKGNLHGSPALNTSILGIGALIAGVAGTTGAAMLLIRPVIRANDNRLHNVHVIIFFIFIVGNMGGALTPLGDPPLFLGFLKGVGFFWPTVHLFGPWLVVVSALLAVFFVLDTHLFRLDKRNPPKPDPTLDSRLSIAGWINIALLAGILLVVLASGLWRPAVGLNIFGVEIGLQDLLRDVVLLLITWCSWASTSEDIRAGNDFSWAPIVEVTKLFGGIFITLIPAIIILKAGSAGALAPVIRLAMDEAGQPNNVMYFWLAGGLSSILDNAPTYLVFFNMAGGDPALLTGPLRTTLEAISVGAVFMGANTYIGNAPNLMVKAIAESQGIRMPSFFGYMAWSGAILVPCFLLLTWLFFL